MRSVAGRARPKQALQSWAVLIIALVLPCSVSAAESFQSEPSWFEPFEPTKLAYTNDDDDRGFIDLGLSVKFPLRWAANLLNSGANEESITHDPFIAFTGRFGFYWPGGRESSPVIGKRYNPVVGWRLLKREQTGALACPKGRAERRTDELQAQTPAATDTFVSAPAMGNRNADCTPVVRESYLQLVYGHESNGQSITTPQEYVAAREAAVARGDDPYTANDAISRGWDYIGLTWRAPPCDWCERSRYLLSNQVNLRYFLDHGLLQRDAEEWHDWEELGSARRKQRARVNGLAVMSTLQLHTCMDAQGRACERIIGDVKFALGYETGHEKPFRHSTVRAEAGVHIAGLPVTVWWQRGYSNDLALYFERGSSFGIGLDIGSF